VIGYQLLAASNGWAQWWRDNGAMVQGLSTVVLVIVTARYVRVTAKILGSQRDMTTAEQSQVLVLEEQLDVSRKALAASREEAQRAHGHAERALQENVHARLSVQTPAVTVQVTPFGYPSGDPALTSATVPRRDETRYTVSHLITIKPAAIGPHRSRRRSRPWRHRLAQEVQIAAGAQRVEQLGQGRLVKGHRFDLLREPG
jgi:hypothetical protein